MNETTALTPAVIALGGGTALYGGIYLYEHRRETAMRASRETYSLVFPVGTDPGAAWPLCGRWPGLGHPSGSRWVRVSVLWPPLRPRGPRGASAGRSPEARTGASHRHRGPGDRVSDGRGLCRALARDADALAHAPGPGPGRQSAGRSGCARPTCAGRPCGRRREGVMIATLGVTAPVSPPADVMLVDPGNFIARMERCASIAWPGRRPTPAYDRVEAQRALDRDAYLLDPVGLRWLPALALHEL